MDPNDKAFASLRDRESELLKIPKATRIPSEYVDRRNALAERLLPKKARDVDERAFLADIRVNSYDKDSWLIYADWLIERGDSNQARTIQNAIEGNYFSLRFSRGFPEAVSCSRAAVDNSGEVLNAMPFLRSLTITAEARDPSPHETTTILSRLKGAAHIEDLELRYPAVEFDMNTIGPAFKRLKRLVLTNPTLTGLQAVLTGPLGTQLQILDAQLGTMEHWHSHDTEQALRTALANWAHRNPVLKETSADLHALLPPDLQKKIKIIDPHSICSRFLASFAYFD